MRDSPKPHLVTENAGPARHQGRTAVHLDPPEAERHRRDRAIKAAEIRYRRVFETAPYGILVLDAETGVVVDVNPCLADMIDTAPGAILDQPLWSIPAFKNAAATKSHFRDVVRQPHVRYDDLPLELKDGQIRHVELVSALFPADSKQYVQCIVHDITERVNRERQDGERAQEERASAASTARRAVHDETHDEATGLSNRWYLEETLPRELHRAERAKTPLTVSVLGAYDDGPLADAVLGEVGRLIREHLRKSDMASRFTDREFVLVLANSTAAATEQRIAEIRGELQKLELSHGDEQLKGPVLYAGIAALGKDGATAHELLDAACAAAKRSRTSTHKGNQ
jgi:diguanylate cyclase (GGDEF)-like protein/PAS domain S-box-containing protein